MATAPRGRVSAQQQIAPFGPGQGAAADRTVQPPGTNAANDGDRTTQPGATSSGVRSSGGGSAGLAVNDVALVGGSRGALEPCVYGTPMAPSKT
jgi:hypothetical protein